MAKKKETSTIDASAYDYKTTKVLDGKGKVVSSTGNGDALQRAMHAFKATGKDFMQVARANKVDIDSKQYDNAGLFRMALGNKLRGLVRNGTPVVVGDITVKSLDQNVKLAEVDGAAPKAAKARKAKSARKPRAKRAAAEAAAA